MLQKQLKTLNKYVYYSPTVEKIDDDQYSISNHGRDKVTIDKFPSMSEKEFLKLKLMLLSLEQISFQIRYSEYPTTDIRIVLGVPTGNGGSGQIRYPVNPKNVQKTLSQIEHLISKKILTMSKEINKMISSLKQSKQSIKQSTIKWSVLTIGKRINMSAGRGGNTFLIGDLVHRGDISIYIDDRKLSIPIAAKRIDVLFTSNKNQQVEVEFTKNPKFDEYQFYLDEHLIYIKVFPISLDAEVEKRKNKK